MLTPLSPGADKRLIFERSARKGLIEVKGVKRWNINTRVDHVVAGYCTNKGRRWKTCRDDLFIELHVVSVEHRHSWVYAPSRKVGERESALLYSVRLPVVSLVRPDRLQCLHQKLVTVVFNGRSLKDWMLDYSNQIYWLSHRRGFWSVSDLRRSVMSTSLAPLGSALGNGIERSCYVRDCTLVAHHNIQPLLYSTPINLWMGLKVDSAKSEENLSDYILQIFVDIIGSNWGVSCTLIA